eukprot:2225136-Alexandrium_andersonii.AAC.1
MPEGPCAAARSGAQACLPRSGAQACRTPLGAQPGRRRAACLPGAAFALRWSPLRLPAVARSGPAVFCGGGQARAQQRPA